MRKERTRKEGRSVERRRNERERRRMTVQAVRWMRG
jgi:hypothetical protein